MPIRPTAGLVLLATLSACADGPTLPPGPDPSPPGAAAAVSPPATLGMERLARALAMAMDAPGLRMWLVARLDASPVREGKLHFQALVGERNGALRAAMAEAAGVPVASIDQDLARGPALELYLPVPGHRSGWRGQADFLVATALTEGDPPVAFDRRGVRRLLDPESPPVTPVLALVPAEQPFGPAGVGMLVCDLCGDAPTPPPTAAAGLYLTAASFTGTFEGWLKGAPEFETHVLGQDGATTLRSYQCAGEHAGGPYAYDQNSRSWQGNVLLFSQAQFDAYRAQHPGQSLRVLVLEDDDGPCLIKTKADALGAMFRALDAAYQAWTAGTDSTHSIARFYTRAKAFQAVYNALASIFNTNDDIVGTAIEDVVVGQTWPGANWIVKGEQNVTHGGIRLEMRQ